MEKLELLIRDLQGFEGITTVNRLVVLERLQEIHQALQLHKTQVSGSVCCDNQKLSWDKHTISIDDKHGSYKDLSFKFCENCGQTFNVEFS